jgi:diadenylate cyclase
MLNLETSSFAQTVSERGLSAILDLLLTVLFFYAILALVHQRRAYFSLLGFGIIFLLYLLSDSLGLLSLSWILDNFLKFSVVILVLLFQDDLRRGLANLYLLTIKPFWKKTKTPFLRIFEETLRELQISGLGAFFCFDRDGLLNEFLDEGVRLEAQFSKELIKTLLGPSSLLKDGAIILDIDGTLKACSVVFPFANQEEKKFEGSAKLQAAAYVSAAFGCLAVIFSPSSNKFYIFKHGNETVCSSAEEAAKVVSKFFGS